MADPIILVSGLGRCGSSLTMQMLYAGGLRCAGTGPSFEGNESRDAVHGMAKAETWGRHLPGHAVKLLDPHIWPPPAGLSYLAIWLTRDLRQQAESQVKMQREFAGIHIDRRGRRKLEASLEREESQARAVLDRACDGVLGMTFEGVLADPIGAATRLRDFVGKPDLDLRKMASVVVQRPPFCLPYMLEGDLVDQWRERRP